MTIPRRSNQSEQRFRALVRALAALFLFLYFFCLQDAALTLAQHQLSRGQTHYHPLIGAVLLTSLLMGLQSLVYKATMPSSGRYVLTFLPSAVCAVMLTTFVPTYRPSALWLTLAMLIVAAVLWGNTATKSPRVRHSVAWFFQGLLLTLYMGLAGNSNEVLNYEVRTARCLKQADYDGVLEVGKRSLAASPHLVALRAYAMSHLPGGLGERIFTMPLTDKGGEQLYLLPADTAQLVFPPDSLYSYLWAQPADSLLAVDSVYHAEVFDRLAQTYPAAPARDYRLCALLLERDLEGFVSELPRYYPNADSIALPRAYAEAALMAGLCMGDTLMRKAGQAVEERFLDFKKREADFPTETSRRNKLREEYGDTYWWYYYYGPAMP